MADELTEQAVKKWAQSVLLKDDGFETPIEDILNVYMGMSDASMWVFVETPDDDMRMLKYLGDTVPHLAALIDEVTGHRPE